jgi:hypothetical protein
MWSTVPEDEAGEHERQPNKAAARECPSGRLPFVSPTIPRCADQRESASRSSGPLDPLPASVCSNRAVHRCRAGVRTSDRAVAASWLSSIQSRARRWSQASRIVRSSPSLASRLALRSCRVRRAPAHRPVRRLVTYITAWCASAIRDATTRADAPSTRSRSLRGVARTPARRCVPCQS